MTAILQGTPHKQMALVTGRAYPEQAEATAACLHAEVLKSTAYDFANGEMYVRFTE
ncbi:MAG: ribose-phosphate diphosphokinase, partial [Bifidobacterium mongoliense]|nr:ribose-phosphate diphosphokinase [Bifidobacterium mongoliense]